MPALSIPGPDFFPAGEWSPTGKARGTSIYNPPSLKLWRVIRLLDMRTSAEAEIKTSFFLTNILRIHPRLEAVVFCGGG